MGKKTNEPSDSPVAQGEAWQETRWGPYLTSIASVVIVAFVQYAAGPLLEDRSHFILFLVAVCFSSWMGGLWPGFLAFVASSLVGSFLFAAPKYSILIQDSGDAISLLLYFVVGGSILYFGERHRQDRRQIEEREAEIRKMYGRLEGVNQELEARVAERTKEIQSTSDLLQTLTYSVAHDLRSALISISANAGIAREDHAHQLDDEARTRLERVSEGCRRASGVVDDLLAHADLGQRPLMRQRVDLSEIAESEAARLATLDWPYSRIEFRIQPGIRVIGDPSLLGTVVRNLMENACKFSRPGEPQLVTVSQDDSDDRAVTVADRGIGFDPRYSDKLFRPFERLHTGFEGSGIGLANAARIVERHGGAIWASCGWETQFSFTIPEHASPHPEVVLPEVGAPAE
jgi:K+-sensing histidine kinase KdpD